MTDKPVLGTMADDNEQRLEWKGRKRWPCIPGERHTFDRERICLCGALFMPSIQDTPWVTVFTPAVNAQHPKVCSIWFASDADTGQGICDCGLAARGYRQGVQLSALAQQRSGPKP